MSKIAGIVYDGNSKVFFYDVKDLNVNENDYVIVQNDRGLELATLLMLNVMNKQISDNTTKILRRATMSDINSYKHNKKDAISAIEDAKRIANKYNLNMKFVNASFTLDRAQLLLTFVSESRIDFRELAKELASIYKTRIELRQIGARDKAKNVSGIGQCGRELCCSCFLKDLDSVSINMAKNQNIALNPNKINGQCGRLLCCLNYEDNVYSFYKKDMPNVGDSVITEKGEGKVISVDILKRTYVVNVLNVGKIEIEMNSLCDGNCNK